MGRATYTVVPYRDGWGVEHDGMTTGPYQTREAAFEAAVPSASIAIAEGHEVDVVVKTAPRLDPVMRS